MCRNRPIRTDSRVISQSEISSVFSLKGWTRCFKSRHKTNRRASYQPVAGWWARSPKTEKFQIVYGEYERDNRSKDLENVPSSETDNRSDLSDKSSKLWRSGCRHRKSYSSTYPRHEYQRLSMGYRATKSSALKASRKWSTAESNDISAHHHCQSNQMTTGRLSSSNILGHISELDISSLQTCFEYTSSNQTISEPLANGSEVSGQWRCLAWPGTCVEKQRGESKHRNDAKNIFEDGQ